MANETQTAYALAICFGLLGPEQEQHAAGRLVELTVKARFHIGTGFAGTPWLLPALSRTGHLDIAYQVLMQTTPPSFLYPLTMGATTVWERWDSVRPDGTLNSTGMTSLNHYAFGAMADWLHRVVGGIEALEPGYRRCRIAPQPGGGLSWARTAHDTVHGRIEVAWDASEDRRAVRVEVPPGVTADVVLPGHPDGLVAVVEAGAHTWEYGLPRGTAHGYALDTPFFILRSDPETWERVTAVVNRLVPGVDNLTEYVEQQHPHLRAMVEDMWDRPDLEQDLRDSAREPRSGRVSGPFRCGVDRRGEPRPRRGVLRRCDPSASLAADNSWPPAPILRSARVTCAPSRVEGGLGAAVPVLPPERAGERPVFPPPAGRDQDKQGAPAEREPCGRQSRHSPSS